MQFFTAPRTLPLLGAPAVVSWGVNGNVLLAFALCTLHECDAQLMPSGLPWSLPATVCVSQHPLQQFLATPAEDPAIH